MHKPPCRMTLVYGLLTLLAAASPRAEEVTYADIAPILQTRCVLCHAGPQAPLGLVLEGLDSLLKGSQNGPVVTAGDPQGNELIRRVKGLSLPRMPLSGPPFLTAQEIELFERWVAEGLQPGSSVVAAPRPAPRPEPGEPVTYAQVAPIFALRCAKCHAPRGLMGSAPEGYLLTSYQSTLASAERVRVVPGSAEASELVRRIRGQALPRMPYDGPPYLDDADIALIVEWINQGARAANGQPAPLPIGGRVRLHGILREGRKLDSLRLGVDAETRLDESPAAGDYVEVRGRLGPGGGVIAERIRPR